MNNYRQLAHEFYKKGELRKSISQYRLALRFEKDHFERSLIYLELTRIYRILVRMKNARLELMRAFEALGLEWPRNTLYALIKSYLRRNQQAHLHPDCMKRSQQEQSQLLAQLYEELGLSAYYLRQNFILLQATVKSKRICHELGPSMPLLNWYGGTACIMSLSGFEKKSLKLIEKCHEISEILKGPKEHGKVLVWKALLNDYNGYPVRSAEIFHRCIEEFGTDLEPFDLRLCSVTLSTNYFCRGHYQKAIDALNRLQECNPCFQQKSEIDNADLAAWYSLGPSIMLEHNVNIEKIIQNFRSILSTDKDEKWLLTQFIGHLLIVKRRAGLNSYNVEDLVRRFEILGMSPTQTHFEASFYWIAEAYLRFDQAQSDITQIKKFKRSLENLAKNPVHPTHKSHYSVLRAGLAQLENKKNNFIFWSQKAANEARIIDNLWALVELKKMKGSFHD